MNPIRLALIMLGLENSEAERASGRAVDYEKSGGLDFAHRMAELIEKLSEAAKYAAMADKEDNQTYLAKALKNREESILEYFKKHDPDFAADYRSLIIQTKKYFEFAISKDVYVNQNIKDSFLNLKGGIEDLVVSNQLSLNVPFFSQYETKKEILLQRFEKYLDDLLKKDDKEDKDKLGLVILRMFNLAYELNMSANGTTESTSYASYLRLHQKLTK